MTTVSNSSFASGQYVNINALVQQAISSQQSLLTTYQNKSTALSTTVSSLGSVKSSISSLNDKFNAVFDSVNKFNTSALPSGLTINATKSGTYNIAASQLSSSQIITSKSYFSSGSLGLTGVLDLNTGVVDNNNNLTINNTKGISVVSTDKLTDIVKKINDAGVGINGAIINASSGQYISLSSSTGSVNGFSLSSIDSNINSVLGASSFNNVSFAKDTLIKFNGVDISSSDRNFKNIDGLTFSVNQTFDNNSIVVSQDSQAIKDSLTNFVNQYNTTVSDIKNSGIKDYSLTRLMDNFRDSFRVLNNKNGLNDLGISFDKSGVMSIDTTKTVTNSSDIINNLFSSDSKSFSILDNSLKTDGIIDGELGTYNAQLKTLNTQIADKQTVISNQENFYQNQYSKLDSYLSQLNNNLGTVTQLMSQFNAVKTN
jgi:flagellar hook-associated protein 2